MTRVTEGAQGCGLSSKMAASRKLAARRGLSPTPFGRRFGRPDLMCSATSRAPLTQLPLCNSPLLPPAACNHRRRIRSGAQRPPIWARSAAVPRVETSCLRKISFTWSPDLGRRFNGQDIRRFPHWARRICGNDRIEAASECGPTTSDVGKRLALFRLRRPDELQESHRRLQAVCPRCIDPPFDRSNGSRLLFCLNKARTPEHGYNRKTADRSRDRGVDARLLARRRPERGCKRPQLFHERL